MGQAGAEVGPRRWLRAHDGMLEGCNVVLGAGQSATGADNERGNRGGGVDAKSRGEAGRSEAEARRSNPSSASF